MHTTPASLLERLRRSGEREAWLRFVELYTPLLYHWARRTGLQEPDAADLVQDVLTLLVQKLPEFSYDRRRSFRNWLRTVTLNKWRENHRRAARVPHGAAAPLDELPAPDDLGVFEESEYRSHLVQRGLQTIESEFPALTWKAFHEYVMAARDAAEVAAELHISTGTVYAAKSRVLSRLRQELAGLVD